MATYITPLKTEEQPALLDHGGKGASLITCMKAGLPVPDGFIVNCNGYSAFVESSDAVKNAVASGDAMEAILNAEIPQSIRQEVETAYSSFSGHAMAVRSSATAEDLPNLSFAGQQDTFLNCCDVDQILDAVLKCWASLYTERAIFYRKAHAEEMATTDLALAVVVQEMVSATSSGVLFTSDPLTGYRHKMSIDATHGLGDMLVSGKITPDHFVIEYTEDRKARIVKSEIQSGVRSVEKAKENGGTSIEEITIDIDSPSLTPSQVMDVVKVGMDVLDLMKGVPQDIEWAITDDRVMLLQARPITSLFPIPDDLLKLDPPKVLWNWGTKQGMLEPMFPLGSDIIRFVTVLVYNEFFKERNDGKEITIEDNKYWFELAGRLWINYSLFLNNRLLRPIIKKQTRKVDPNIGQIAENLMKDAALFPADQRSGIIPLLKLAWPFFMKLRRGGDTVKRDVVAAREKYLQCEKCNHDMVKSLMEEPVDGDVSDQVAFNNRVKTIELTLKWFYEELDMVAGILLHGNNSLLKLSKLAAKYMDMEEIEAYGTLQGGALYNPTTQMDLDLWEATVRIREDQDSNDVFANSTLAELETLYKDEKLPEVAQTTMTDALDKYGFRAFSEIDIGRPRWKDEPIRMFSTISGLLKLEISEDHPAPPDKFGQQGKNADEFAERLAAAVPFWKRKQVRTLYSRGRELVGLRDSPKMHLMRNFELIRQALRKNGDILVSNGILEARDDIFFLRMRELLNMDIASKPDFITVTRDRKQEYNREMNRKQVPFMLITDGRAFIDMHHCDGYGYTVSQESGDNTIIHASPVSPGVVEGRANVVFDPVNACIEKGDILVCRGTDPSWTPIFFQIKGIVMETGGLMTHGSVVAREYGIPAVIGAGNATTTIKTGQMIKLDAVCGVITLMEKEEEKEE